MRIISTLVTFLLAASPALAQATLTTDALMTHSPYYREYRQPAKPLAGARVGVLPARLDHPAADRMRQKLTAITSLLDSVNGFLRRQGLAPVALPDDTKPRHLPNAWFGAPAQELPGQLPPYVPQACPTGQGHCVILAGWPGQGKTLQALRDAMRQQQLDYLLVPVLREVTFYPSAAYQEKGLVSSAGATAGNYYVDLGSDHVEHRERLQPLDASIGALMLTGALLDAEGQLVLIGAEGMRALNVGLVESPRELLRNEPYASQPADLQAVMAPADQDPAAWRRATDQLYRRLTYQLPHKGEKRYQIITNTP